ncbi:MAG: hypothetical protein HY059_05545 [Proteobacteria bacterium]|nr:hypothetical protein [Pseudomonadota bacterium]
MSMHKFVACGSVLIVAACASGGAAPASTTASGVSAEATVRRDPNVITRAELSDVSLRSLNVYDAIKALRPAFLTVRGVHTLTPSAAGTVHASIDGNGVTDLDDLKRMQASVVIEIRLLAPAAAMQRFGAPAQEGPVILVRTM